MKFRRSSAARRRIAADPGKPLTARARGIASQELGALCRAAGAARETAESGVPVTAESMLKEILAMEKTLAGLRELVTYEL